ncbi:Subunit of heteropentameric Replication factor C (RF-C) [Hypoxylon texense]
MSILIPEILGIICSFLDIKDVRRFRLCCKAFADVGACFVHRNIVFFLHHGDFEMLQRISLDPVASKNVRSLVYSNQVLVTPKLTWERFRSSYATLRHLEKCMGRYRNIPPTPLIGVWQLLKLYEDYEITIDQQEKIMQANADFSHIREAISRFPALQEVTVSSGGWFWDGKKTPFDSCLGLGVNLLEPVGCRHLDALLAALFEADIKLKKLTAGVLSWHFFQKPRAQLGQALSLLTDLTCLELMIDTTGNTSQCQQLLDTGLLRGFIKSLTKLQTLHVVFTWDLNYDKRYLPRLEDIIDPKYRWDDLDSLTLGNVSCERQELMSVLKRHKNTLRELCLQDIHLRSTSWLVLLPKVRRTMDLDHACMCGVLYGMTEPLGYEEYFDLEEQRFLRDDLNDYLVNDNIRRCPLKDEMY